MAQYRENTTRLINRSPQFSVAGEVSIPFLCLRNSYKCSTWSCSNGVPSYLCRTCLKRDSASHIMSTKARTILSKKFPGTAKPTLGYTAIQETPVAERLPSWGLKWCNADRVFLFKTKDWRSFSPCLLFALDFVLVFYESIVHWSWNPHKCIISCIPSSSQLKYLLSHPYIQCAFEKISTARLGRNGSESSKAFVTIRWSVTAMHR